MLKARKGKWGRSSIRKGLKMSTYDRILVAVLVLVVRFIVMTMVTMRSLSSFGILLVCLCCRRPRRRLRSQKIEFTIATHGEGTPAVPLRSLALHVLTTTRTPAETFLFDKFNNPTRCRPLLCIWNTGVCATLGDNLSSSFVQFTAAIRAGCVDLISQLLIYSLQIVAAQSNILLGSCPISPIQTGHRYLQWVLWQMHARRLCTLMVYHKLLIVFFV